MRTRRSGAHPARCGLRTRGWEQAIEAIPDRVAEATRGLTDSDHEVDPVASIELTGAGLPEALLVRLKKRTSTPPKGWTSLPDRPGLLTRVVALEKITTARIRSLTDLLPPGLRAGKPYARILDSSRRGRRIWLALPYGAD